MDLDFGHNQETGEIFIDPNMQSVSGNRALVNLFQCTLLTKVKQYTESSFDSTTGTVASKIVIDSFGGDAEKYLTAPSVSNTVQGVAAAMSTSISQTIQCIKDNQDNQTPNTEKLLNAKLNSLDIINGIVTAVIEIIPVEYETWGQLMLNLPIVRIGV